MLHSLGTVAERERLALLSFQPGFLFFVQGDGLGEEGFFLCFFLAGLKEH